MSQPYDLTAATECLEKLVDQIRCIVCDGNEGTRVRYPCSHGACSGCAEIATECLVCLTPPDASATYTFDDPLTIRAQNVSKLLKIYQDTFHIDVQRQQRLSERLKIEREVFPKCIQGNKYFNKRKSTSNRPSKEDRRSSQLTFASEIVLNLNSMNNTCKYVAKWLEEIDQVEPERIPFADLPVNNTREKGPHSTALKNSTDTKYKQLFDDDTENDFKTSTLRKRSHLKINKHTTVNKVNTNIKSTRGEENKWKSAKRIKKEMAIHKKQQLKLYAKDESGIVMDDDPIIIEDSQIDTVDKDQKAWLAVLEADREIMDISQPSTSKHNLECTEVINYTDEVEKTVSRPQLTSTPRGENKKYVGLSPWLNTTNDSSHNFNYETRRKENFHVPFYKKSKLYDTCKGCDINVNSKKSADQSKDVSITIQTSTYSTTIRVSNNRNYPNKKQSQEIQTDFAFKSSEQMQNKPKLDPVEVQEKELTAGICIDSEDLFTEDIAVCSEKIDDVKELAEKTTEISDSGSEKNIYTVLTSLEQNEQGMRAAANRGRRYVASSDSSDKENCDPNRKRTIKGQKDAKKKKKKKNI